MNTKMLPSPKNAQNFIEENIDKINLGIHFFYFLGILTFLPMFIPVNLLALMIVKMDKNNYFINPVYAKKLLKNKKILDLLESDGYVKEKFFRLLSLETTSSTFTINKDYELTPEDYNLCQEFEDKVGIITRSKVMLDILADIKYSSSINKPVLVQGEFGSGKELISEAIHNYSGREGEFVPIKSSYIKEDSFDLEMFGSTVKTNEGGNISKDGYFERSENGTIMFDECERLPLSFQTQLVQTLKSKSIWKLGVKKKIPIDIKYILASGYTLEKNMMDKDLYYKLSKRIIKIPRLNEHRIDIPYIAKSTLENELKDANITLDFQVEVKLFNYLMDRKWPDNITELKWHVEDLASTFIKGKHTKLDLDKILSDDLEKYEHLQSIQENIIKEVNNAFEASVENAKDSPNHKENISENSFIKKGRFWLIKYEGESATLGHFKGLEYLYILIANKGKPISTEKLYLQVNPQDLHEVNKHGSLIEDNIPDDDSSIDKRIKVPAVDKRTIKEVKEQIEYLDDRIKYPGEDDDDEDIKKYMQEQDKLKEYLRSNTYNNSSTLLYDAFKKNRQNVSKAIKKALLEIQNECPAFYTHLWKAMGEKVGAYPKYDPGNDIDWITE